MLNIWADRRHVLGSWPPMVTSYTTETAGVSATSIVGGGSGHENSKGAAMVRS